MKKEGETKPCFYCGKPVPKERPFNYGLCCTGKAPKKRYVVAGFGTKGNGAHVTEPNKVKSDFDL